MTAKRTIQTLLVLAAVAAPSRALAQPKAPAVPPSPAPTDRVGQLAAKAQEFLRLRKTMGIENAADAKPRLEELAAKKQKYEQIAAELRGNGLAVGADLQRKIEEAETERAAFEKQYQKLVALYKELKDVEANDPDLWKRVAEEVKRQNTAAAGGESLGTGPTLLGKKSGSGGPVRKP